MSDSGHWANIAERGSTFGMRILVSAYRIGGRPLFRVCLFPVILVFFLVRGELRRASLYYLQRMRPYQGADWRPGWLLGFRHFWQFAESLIDKFAIWFGDIHREHVHIYGVELIDELLSEGRGAVLAISHLGNFEVISALSATHDNVRLTVLHHTEHTKKFNQVLEQYSDRSQIDFMQVTQLDAAVAIKLSEKVSCGELIALAADRIPVNNSSAVSACDFLDETASFPIGCYVLAHALQVPVICVFCIKQENTYNIYFETLSKPVSARGEKRAELINQAAQKYAALLQAYCVRAPLQWFNFYQFWRQEKECGDE